MVDDPRRLLLNLEVLIVYRVRGGGNPLDVACCRGDAFIPHRIHDEMSRMPGLCEFASNLAAQIQGARQYLFIQREGQRKPPYRNVNAGEGKSERKGRVHLGSVHYLSVTFPIGKSLLCAPTNGQRETPVLSALVGPFEGLPHDTGSFRGVIGLSIQGMSPLR